MLNNEKLGGRGVFAVSVLGVLLGLFKVSMPFMVFLLVPLVFVLSGCSWLSTLWSVKQVTALAAAGVSEVGRLNLYTKKHGKLPFNEVCIEWNASVAVPELLPALQDGLKRFGVASAIYAPGTEPQGCYTVYYNAAREWDGGKYRMRSSVLSMRHEGKLIGNASYNETPLAMDRWSSTGSKLESTIESLLYGG